MPRRKGNKGVRSEEVIQQASDAIKLGEVRSAYAAEKKFGVRRLNCSQKSCARARESQQLLTIPKEDILVAWCHQLTVSHWVSGKA